MTSFSELGVYEALIIAKASNYKKITCIDGKNLGEWALVAACSTATLLPVHTLVCQCH